MSCLASDRKVQAIPHQLCSDPAYTWATGKPHRNAVALKAYLNPTTGGPVLTSTPFVRSRSWLAVGTAVGPGTGAGADVGRDGDTGREGGVGDGLVPGGGQR